MKPLLHRTLLAAVAALALVSFFAGHVGAAEPRTLNVLFIGNSFTGRHNLAQVVKAMAEAGNPGLRFDVTTVIYGGRTLKDHWRLGTQNFVRHAALTAEEERATIKGLEAALAQDAGDTYARTALQRHRQLLASLDAPRRTWDVVVLQSYQDDTQGEACSYVEYAPKFAELIKAQGGQVVLYETTPATQNAEPLKAAPERAPVEAKARVLAALARRLDAKVVPMSTVARHSQTVRPDITLRFVNDGHLNQTMAYLTACTFFAALFERSPEGLPVDHVTDIRFLGPAHKDQDRDGHPITRTFSAEERGALQRIAWEGWQEFGRIARTVAAASPAAAVGASAGTAAVGHAPQRFHLTKRASEIDPRAKEHPEIEFVFTDKAGKVQDLEHGVVDTRVVARNRLVIWLMGYSEPLFQRLGDYGFHAIQVHYANKWFGLVPAKERDDGTTLGKIRLEAATGEDFSPFCAIPKPDGMMERAFQFVQWLARENPAGQWDQFLDREHGTLRWDKVIVSGSSHGATTATRFAVHQRVDRVVAFCGPRDQLESWQGFPSATPPNRIFAFSHVLDGGWTGDHYCRSWQMLGLHRYGAIVDVDDSAPPFGYTRRLITHADVGGNATRAHSSVVPGNAAVKDASGKFIHEVVWRYLFTQPVEQTGPAVPPDTECGAKIGPPRTGKR